MLSLLQRAWRFCRGDGSLTLAVAILMVFVFFLCALLGLLLLRRVLRDGRINLNRIMGAIGSYLLLGILFTEAYGLLAHFIPGAFAIGGAAAAYPDIAGKLSYFSFITLTSTGFGDITPLHPYARSMATLEALSGGLFLTVLVARLVAHEVEWRASRQEAARGDC